MKYELVDSLPLNPSLVDVIEPAATSPDEPGSGRAPREDEDTSYAASLKFHFSHADPAHPGTDMGEHSENAEPNVTRCFRNVAGVGWNTSLVKSHALSTWDNEKNADIESESVLSSPTRPLSGSSGSHQDLMKQEESTEAPDILDRIVEIGSVSSTVFVDGVSSDRQTRRLIRIATKKLSCGDERVVARGLRKLADSCLEKTSPHRCLLVQSGALSSIVAAIKTFPNSSTVVSRGLRALQNITCRSLLARETLRHLDGARTICSAMRGFISDVKVQRDGCGALLNFLLEDDCDNSRTESFVREGGLEVVLAAMGRHRGDLKLNEWACRCVHGLCKNRKDHHLTVWNSGGFTAILIARDNHPENHGIAKAARSANRMFWNEYESLFERKDL